MFKLEIKDTRTIFSRQIHDQIYKTPEFFFKFVVNTFKHEGMIEKDVEIFFLSELKSQTE